MNIALITGASSGIGYSAAIQVAQRGVGVILTYHRQPDGAQAAVREIEAAGGAAVALQLDVSQISTFAAFGVQVKQLLQERWQRDSLDYLVNNAGVAGGTPFAEISEREYDRLLDTNLKGPFFLTQTLLPLISDGGHIVNVSSNAARLASPGFSAYGASKAGLTALTRYLAKELSPRGIRANSVSPGPVLTNLADGAFAKHPEYIAPLAAQTALGRIGTPEDLGRVIAALLSEDCGWITAQDIEVSGGFLL